MNNNLIMEKTSEQSFTQQIGLINIQNESLKYCFNKTFANFENDNVTIQNTKYFEKCLNDYATAATFLADKYQS